GYDSSLELETDSTSIACTLYGADRPARIIKLMGYSFDIEPASTSLVLEYFDAPGRMGTIGTILGDAGVNITTMQIGKKEGGDHALVFLNVEGEIGEDLLEKLRASIPDLRNLWLLNL
ncbi:MAG: ACT domain-containing protein, partial [Eggerthellaceae bacterium]|nr:ACT domain-containing protein [Eggerthellaceae bacterium]